MRPTANTASRRIVLAYLLVVIAVTALLGSINPGCLNPGAQDGGATPALALGR
jgi:hypothetical protein